MAEYHEPGPPGAAKPDFFARCADAAIAAQTTLQPLVRFPVDATDTVRSVLVARDARDVGEITSYHLAPYGAVRAFRLPTPDGALIEFYSPDD